MRYKKKLIETVTDKVIRYLEENPDDIMKNLPRISMLINSLGNYNRFKKEDVNENLTDKAILEFLNSDDHGTESESDEDSEIPTIGIPEERHKESVETVQKDG